MSKIKQNILTIKGIEDMRNKEIKDCILSYLCKYREFL